jgi:hypothetical protein
MHPTPAHCLQRGFTSLPVEPGVPVFRDQQVDRHFDSEKQVELCRGSEAFLLHKTDSRTRSVPDGTNSPTVTFILATLASSG